VLPRFGNQLHSQSRHCRMPHSVGRQNKHSWKLTQGSLNLNLWRSTPLTPPPLLPKPRSHGLWQRVWFYGLVPLPSQRRHSPFNPSHLHQMCRFPPGLRSPPAPIHRTTGLPKPSRPETGHPPPNATSRGTPNTNPNDAKTIPTENGTTSIGSQPVSHGPSLLTQKAMYTPQNVVDMLVIYSSILTSLVAIFPHVSLLSHPLSSATPTPPPWRLRPPRTLSPGPAGIPPAASLSLLSLKPPA
jgi:hypothetical protein